MHKEHTVRWSALLWSLCAGVVLFGLALPVPFQAQNTSSPAPATNVAAKTPQELADLVLQRFASGTAEEFESIYPDISGREVLRTAVQRRMTRQGNLGKVIWSDPKRAVLLLTGTVVASASGAETIQSRHFSGIYEALESDGRWKVTRQLHFDDKNRITAQEIEATIAPGKSIEVTDTLRIVVGSRYGFAARLNDRAQLKTVLLDGKPADYAFGGGVLWLRTKPRDAAKLSLSYTIAADRERGDTTAAGELPRSGEFRNDNVWTPLFDFDSSNDFAEIGITVRIPAEYRLTTSLPQTETVENGMRVVKGRTRQPQFALNILFDRDWLVKKSKFGNVEFETFLTPDFRWSHEVLAAEAEAVYKALVPRFGDPTGGYLAAAEERNVGERGFMVRANYLVVSGKGGGKLLRAEKDQVIANPSASFAHEVTHAWTLQIASGPAANFLREGWANFATFLFLGAEYGPEVEKSIYDLTWAGFTLARHDGNRSILGNPDNGGIHYVKGSWILHMLESVMGEEAFDRGMRAYMQIPGGQPGGHEAFITAMSKAAGHDMGPFLMPWLDGKYIPDVDARIEGTHIIVAQQQSDVVFDLPLKLSLTTASGTTVERTIHLTRREDTLDTQDLGAIKEVRVDPDHQFLMRRHWGEIVRFELRAANAKEVALGGLISVKPIPATRNGNIWTVDVPLTEGLYPWTWQVDGKLLAADYDGQPATGVKLIRASQRVMDAYPK